MLTEISEEELYRHARKQVERLFFTHWAVYVVVNSVLAIIWRVAGKGFPWLLIPIGAWGMVVLLHLLSVSVLLGRRQPSERTKASIARKVAILKKQQTKESQHLRQSEAKKPGS